MRGAGHARDGHEGSFEYSDEQMTSSQRSGAHSTTSSVCTKCSDGKWKDNSLGAACWDLGSNERLIGAALRPACTRASRNDPSLPW
jgi:hypothetical protein